jgi:hypothetical protein
MQLLRLCRALLAESLNAHCFNLLGEKKDPPNGGPVVCFARLALRQRAEESSRRGRGGCLDLVFARMGCGGAIFRRSAALARLVSTAIGFVGSLAAAGACS